MTPLQTRTRWGLWLTVLSLPVLSLTGLVGSASAQAPRESTCAIDSDCEHGYTCQVTVWGSSCPDIACPSGTPCEQQPACEAESGEIRDCVAGGPCATAADCIDGWVCAESATSDCGGVSMEPAARPAPCAGDDCTQPEPTPEPTVPPECQTTTTFYCSPPYFQPCAEAADCGPGFNCAERIAGSSCSGSSGGTGEPEDAGVANPTDPADPQPFAPPQELPPEEMPPPDETCTEEPTGEFYCELIETPCTTDQDCASGLICQLAPDTSTCSGGAEPVAVDAGAADSSGSSSGTAGSGAAGAGGAGAAPPAGDGDSDLRVPPSDCGASTAVHVCAPPDYYTMGGSARGESTSLDNAGSGGAATPQDDGAEPPEEDGDSPTGAPSPEPSDADDAASSDLESSGCSATGHGGASGSMLILMLAVLGLASRRRTRRA